MADNALLKNSLNTLTISELAKKILSVYQDFDQQKFCQKSELGLSDLELKARVNHIIQALVETLPSDFKYTSTFLMALPKQWNKNKIKGTMSEFSAWPIIDYVAIAGIDYPHESLLCLEKLTVLFSAEFAIRPFIEKYPVICFSLFEDWVSHPSEHVRRLVSEGTRPRLPWGRRLHQFIDNPEVLLPLLGQLNTDKSLYVRRSVANNLNDISKDHPERVIAVCREWQEKYKNSQEKNKIDWIIRHATRGLVKQGHPKIFPLLGYSAKPEIRLLNFCLNEEAIRLESANNENTIKLENKDKQILHFEIVIESLKDQKYVIDYAIYFIKKNGHTAPKVFKLKNCQSKKLERIEVNKTHNFKRISTRKYYPGRHELAILINGVELGRKAFDLVSA